MQYALKRSEGSAVGYCSLSIKCGTRDENGFPEGLAHFTEHTIFKGTSKRTSSAINSYLDKLGGELNAYTTKEEIVIHATVLKEDLPKAAGLLFELATMATFPEKEIELEKNVVIDEIASCKDVPSDDIYDRFETLLFEGHPLSRMILGTKSSVLKISRQNLVDFTKRNFIASNMAFSAVADEDEGKLEKLALKLSREYFDDCPEVPQRALERPQVNVFDKRINKHTHQVCAIMGGLAPSLYDEKERIATILLCNILGGPATNSILNNVLREKHGWVYGVECSFTQYADTGIVTISLGCDKENLEKCLVAIGKEIEKLQSAPLSPTRLKAYKRQLLGQLAISSDNGEAQCLSMGKSLLAYSCVKSSEENIKQIMDVTAEQIQSLACRLFAKDQLSSLIYY